MKSHTYLSDHKPQSRLWEQWILGLFAWMFIGGISAGQTISTVAGGGSGFPDIGDGGPAIEASLSSPWGVHIDLAGNLYIADRGNERIRKVGRTGFITTVAGGGIQQQGTTTAVRIGDGGPATLASFSGAASVFVDGSGRIYCVDTAAQGIRKVDGGGVVTTAVGGNFGNTIGDGDLATKASLLFINGGGNVIVDGSGHLYIADMGHHRIRKVDEQNLITTVVGVGQSGFSGDGDQALNARLNSPWDVYLDDSGTLYIADTDNHRIRKVDGAGIITTVAGNGKPGFSGDGGQATDASLNFPKAIIGDELGNLYIADTDNHRIRKVDRAGIITTVAGTGDSSGPLGDGGPATEASLWEPHDVVVDGVGNLYIADTLHHLIRKVAVILKVDLAADPAVITTDGEQASVIRAQILNTEDVLLSGDNSTRIRFEILEGEGTLSTGVATVKGGVAEVRLVSRTAGIVTVQASVDDIGNTTVSVAVKASVSPETIRASDFNGDGNVEFGDFLEFVSGFGKKLGDSGYDPKLDLDANQEIGFQDFLIFIGTFGRSVDR